MAEQLAVYVADYGTLPRSLVDALFFIQHRHLDPYYQYSTSRSRALTWRSPDSVRYVPV